jgi:hypothetical protein
MPIPKPPPASWSKSPTRSSRQDGRIFIELINWPFLSELKGTPAEYKAGLDLAIARGWLTLDRSGTFVKFTQVGAELFACSRVFIAVNCDSKSADRPI